MIREPWTCEVPVPVVLHRDAGVTYATGGGTRTEPTKAGQVAFGRVLTIITPGRQAIGRPTFLDADRAARARTNTQTSDPIEMPDAVKVRPLKTGLTYHARKVDPETGLPIGELREREPKSDYIVALSDRTGTVKVTSANKGGIGWGRTWGRKGKGARPFKTSSLPNGQRNPRR